MKIHIKKSHEGRFTAYKKRTGKTTEEALHSKDPHVRQMANFANNAKHWKHKFGGAVDSDNENTKELTKYNGPKHEDGGIAISTTGSSTPNAEVEGGETSYKNYVYSDSLFDDKGKSMADVSKQIDNRYKGRYDPVTNKSREIELTNLMHMNETMRKEKESSEFMKKYGGIINTVRKYKFGGPDGLGPDNPYAGVEGTFDSKGGVGNIQGLGGNQNITALPKYDDGSTLPSALKGANIGMQTGNGISSQPTTTNTNSDTNKQSLTTGDALQLAGTAASAGFNLIQSLRPYDKVSPALNPYTQKIKDLMANRRYNPQTVENQINLSANAAKNTINEGSLSDSVRRANLASNYATTADTLAKANISGQQMNNQLRGEEASTLNTLGNQEVREVNSAYDAEARNKGTRNNFGAAAASQIGQGLANTGQFSNQNKTNEISLSVLNSMAKNFGVDPETYIIKFKKNNPNVQVVNK